MKLITFEEALDRHFGEIGTPERDDFEHNVDEAVRAWKIDEALEDDENNNLISFDSVESLMDYLRK